MVVVLDRNADQHQIENVINKIEQLGFSVQRSTGSEQVILNVIGIKPNFDIRRIKILEGVSEVYRITDPLKLASRNYKQENTIIKIKDIQIGGNEVIVIAGPCSIENRDQIFTLAEIVAKGGAKILRGGAFKPRSSPYSFQGLGEEGLKLMREAADQNNLLIITEVIEPSQISLVGKYTDIFQVGSRNMQNYPLLIELGKTVKPIMLKRGMAATIEDWLMSAEYILSNGNMNIMLCERGIRTFETYTRNTFDLSAIPVVHQRSHLPIVADPSHATGLRDKVLPMSRAAIAAGADALMVEVHHDPENALSDGPQALLPEQFYEMMRQIRLIADVIGRKI